MVERGVSITSFLAYMEKLETIPENQMQVIKVIKDLKECSNRQIAEELGWEINRVTGRVNELHHNGLIVNSKKDGCPIVMRDEDKRRLVKFWRMARRI